MNFEQNDDWGEVTPWPQDPTAGFWRGLDRGVNPGYAGQCFVGDPQWFIDGELPCDILSRVPPVSFPDCCFPSPAQTDGGIVIGGTAVPAGGGGPIARTAGGIVLGGTGSPAGEGTLATTKGGIVLGGSGKPSPQAGTVGGVVLGGSSSGSGGVMGGPTCDKAGQLIQGQVSGPNPFTVGYWWFSLYATAGQTIHWSVQFRTDGNLHWTFFTGGSCQDLGMGQSGGYGCTQAPTTFTGWYYWRVQVVAAAPGTWFWEVDPGPCP
ncbi:MAG TPA: hypothetical protein VJR90_11355 [Gammaproteobacteria bacterium]|nr:hypothetical protein [Gammaproteobacteria bacterium]